MNDLIVDHFQLRRHPFSVEIDAEAFYPFQSFQQGTLRLEQASHARRPVLVIAEPGAGKTALIRAYCKRLASSSFEVRHQLVGPGKSPIIGSGSGFDVGTPKGLGEGGEHALHRQLRPDGQPGGHAFQC